MLEKKKFLSSKKNIDKIVQLAIKHNGIILLNYNYILDNNESHTVRHNDNLHIPINVDYYSHKNNKLNDISKEEFNLINEILRKKPENRNETEISKIASILGSSKLLEKLRIDTLPKEEINRILFSIGVSAKIKMYKPDSYVFYQADTADGFYVLLDGKVSVYIDEIYSINKSNLRKFFSGSNLKRISNNSNSNLLSITPSSYNILGDQSNSIKINSSEEYFDFILDLIIIKKENQLAIKIMKLNKDIFNFDTNDSLKIVDVIRILKIKKALLELFNFVNFEVIESHVNNPNNYYIIIKYYFDFLDNLDLEGISLNLSYNNNLDDIKLNKNLLSVSNNVNLKELITKLNSYKEINIEGIEKNSSNKIKDDKTQKETDNIKINSISQNKENKENKIQKKNSLASLNKDNLRLYGKNNKIEHCSKLINLANSNFNINNFTTSSGIISFNIKLKECILDELKKLELYKPNINVYNYYFNSKINNIVDSNIMLINRKYIKTLHPGDYFGDIALDEFKLRTASIKTNKLNDLSYKNVTNNINDKVQADNIQNKRRSSIETQSLISVIKIPNDAYKNYLQIEANKTKLKDTMFLIDNYFFKNIPSMVFTNKYFQFFTKKVYYKNEYLFRNICNNQQNSNKLSNEINYNELSYNIANDNDLLYNTIFNKIYFIVSGRIKLNIEKSVLSLNKLISYIIESLLYKLKSIKNINNLSSAFIKNFKDKNNAKESSCFFNQEVYNLLNKEKLLNKLEELSVNEVSINKNLESKLFSNNSKAKNSSNSNLNIKELTKKRTFEVSTIENISVLGIEELLLNSEIWLKNCIVSSSEVVLYELDLENFFKLLHDEDFKYSLLIYTIKKIYNFINQLSCIKNNILLNSYSSSNKKEKIVTSKNNVVDSNKNTYNNRNDNSLVDNNFIINTSFINESYVMDSSKNKTIEDKNISLKIISKNTNIKITDDNNYISGLKKNNILNKDFITNNDKKEIDPIAYKFNLKKKNKISLESMEIFNLNREITDMNNDLIYLKSKNIINNLDVKQKYINNDKNKNNINKVLLTDISSPFNKKDIEYNNNKKPVKFNKKIGKNFNSNKSIVLDNCKLNIHNNLINSNDIYKNNKYCNINEKNFKLIVCNKNNIENNQNKSKSKNKNKNKLKSKKVLKLPKLINSKNIINNCKANKLNLSIQIQNYK